jgi:Dihydroorotase and related cyclic amidohydrolases
MPSTLIVNARLVNEGQVLEGDLRIEQGRIAQIGSGLAAVTASRSWMPPAAGCCRG